MRIFMLILALLPAVCMAELSIRPGENDEENSEPKMTAQSGVVIARVINASPYSYNFNYITLAPKGVYEKKENKFEIIAMAKALPGRSTIFATPVPAGDYSLANIYSSYFYYDGQYYSKAQLAGDADPKFGTFKIEPGKITNLGTIIYYQKPDGDKYIPLLARKDEFNEGLEYLKSEKPELYKQLDTASVLSWNKDDFAAERNDLYLNMAQNPVTFDKAYPQDDGGWYFTGKLGVLLHRAAQGKWSIEAIDSDYDIMLFASDSKGDLAAMDETGSLFLKTAGAGKWVSIPKPETEGRVIRHIGFGNAGNIHVFSVSESEIEVYSGKISENPGWAVSMTYESKLGWYTPDKPLVLKPNRKGRIERGKVQDFGAVTLRDVTLVIVNKKIYQLKPELAGATQLDIDFEPTEISHNAYNQLSISRQSFGSDPGLGGHVSIYTLDAGATWHTYSERYDRCPGTKIKRNPPLCPNGDARFTLSHPQVATPVFFPDGKGYAIAFKVEIAKKGFFAPITRTAIYELVVSEDEGKTWSEFTGSELPKHCGGLRKGRDENTLLLSCENATGQFYRADRKTLKWEIDYQPALF